MDALCTYSTDSLHLGGFPAYHHSLFQPGHQSGKIEHLHVEYHRHVLAVLLIHRLGIYYMILMYTCINIGWLFIWYYFVHREIGLRFLDAIKDIAPFAGTSLIAMGVSFMVTRYITSEWLLMIGKILIAASVYLAILWVSRSRIQQEMLQYLFKKK